MIRAGGGSRSRSLFPEFEKHKTLMWLGVILMDHDFLSVSLTSGWYQPLSSTGFSDFDFGFRMGFCWKKTCRIFFVAFEIWENVIPTHNGREFNSHNSETSESKCGTVGVICPTVSFFWVQHPRQTSFHRWMPPKRVTEIFMADEVAIPSLKTFSWLTFGCQKCAAETEPWKSHEIIGRVARQRKATGNCSWPKRKTRLAFDLQHVNMLVFQGGVRLVFWWSMEASMEIF